MAETKDHDCQGTSIPLKDYIEKIITSNDRRYTEVDIERDKALIIKEEAVKTALGLASADLKNAIDDLKETIKPLSIFVSNQQGRSGGLNAGWGYLVGAIGLVTGIIGLFFKLGGK